MPSDNAALVCEACGKRPPWPFPREGDLCACGSGLLVRNGSAAYDSKSGPLTERSQPSGQDRAGEAQNAASRGFAGPTPAEWLNAVTKRAKFDSKTGTITADVDDWGNLVAAAKIAYGITDEELADLNPVVRHGR